MEIISDTPPEEDCSQAIKHPATSEFMNEFLALCRKHNVAILPTYESAVSLHDSMVIVPLTPDFIDFYETGVYVYFKESA